MQASYYIEGNELFIDKGQPGIALKKETLKNDILQHIQNRNATEIISQNKEDIIEMQVDTLNPEPINLDKIYAEVHSEPQDAYYIEQPFQIFKEKDGVDFAISMEEAKLVIADETKTEYTIPLKLTPAAKTIDDIGTEAFPYEIAFFSTKYDASNKIEVVI